MGFLDLVVSKLHFLKWHGVKFEYDQSIKIRRPWMRYPFNEVMRSCNSCLTDLVHGMGTFWQDHRDFAAPEIQVVTFLKFGCDITLNEEIPRCRQGVGGRLWELLQRSCEYVSWHWSDIFQNWLRRCLIIPNETHRHLTPGRSRTPLLTRIYSQLS